MDNLKKDILEHAGVKGMKWGRRKSPEELGPKRQKKMNKKALKKWDKNFNKDFHNLINEAYNTRAKDHNSKWEKKVGFKFDGRDIRNYDWYNKYLDEGLRKTSDMQGMTDDAYRLAEKKYGKRPSLSHAGVKGMKWGIRNSETGKLKRKKDNPYSFSRHPISSTRKVKTEIKKLETKAIRGGIKAVTPKHKKMSDDELLEKTYRQKLENDYRRARKESRTIGGSSRRELMNDLLTTTSLANNSLSLYERTKKFRS